MFGVYLAGTIEGVKVFESSLLGHGFRSAGLCLPGIGIFVGQGTFSIDRHTVMHEYGHILQARIIGIISFYIIIGSMSLISAWTKGFARGHQLYWTESWSNYLAKEYFQKHYGIIWDDYRFPPTNISEQTLKWIIWK